MSQIDFTSIMDGYPVILFQICTTVCTLKAARCTPLLSVSGSRIKAKCCLTGRAQDVLFVDDNNIAKLPVNLAAADGVAYSSDTHCSSPRTSQFYFLNILAD